MYYYLRTGAMSESWYDTAQVCWHGHLINGEATSSPEMNIEFCERCGAETITTCPLCDTPIRGVYHLSGTLRLTPYSPPAYCAGCGIPYPWTESRMQAAQELIEGMERLSAEEKTLLKVSIRDLATDTPDAPLAVAVFKRLMTKAGKGAAESLREILVMVLGEAAKRALWG